MPYSPTISDNVTVDEVRSHLGGAAEYLLGLNKTEPEKRDASWEEDWRSASNFINQYDRIEKGLAAKERTSESEGIVHRSTEAPEARSVGESLVQNEAYEDWVRSGADKRTFPAIEVRTLLDSAGNDNAALLRPVGSPTLATQNVDQRRLFIRDVITTQQTGLSSVPYIRELNSDTNAFGASATAETQTKWEATMEFEQDDAPIRKITAWIPATSEILADAPTLRGYIDTRLRYMLLLREEAQVLNGVGVAPHLKGIRQFSGVQTVSSVNDDLPAVVGTSISKIENVNGSPTAAAINPLDFWLGVIERHSSQFDNGFGGNAPAVMSGLTWGLLPVRTRSMEQGKMLIGDYRLGATLFDREAITIDTSESHSTYFVENKVAIRAEERIGLAVYRPDWFVVASITFT